MTIAELLLEHIYNGCTDSRCHMPTDEDDRPRMLQICEHLAEVVTEGLDSTV